MRRFTGGQLIYLTSDRGCLGFTKMYQATESEAKVVYKKNHYLLTRIVNVLSMFSLEKHIQRKCCIVMHPYPTIV